MNKHGRVLVSVLLVFGMHAVFAQQTPPRGQSPADVLRNLQHSSDDIEQLRAALHSPNPSVRSAAFTAMMQSDNPALRTLAIDEGHAGSDAVLRDLSSRAAFGELRSLIVEPTADMSSPDMQSSLINFSSDRGLQIRAEKYDPTSGVFTVIQGQGQVSGTRLTFRTTFCQGTLVAVEGSWVYEGQVVCLNGPTKLVGKMRASLR